MNSGILKLDHHPKPRPKKSTTLYDFLKMAFFFVGFPRNGFISVDVTDDCNLRCKHCYFFEQEEHAECGEYSIEQWVERFEELKREQPWKFPFLQCTWVGGEPLIRKELIERCKSYFLYNTVVTNGTIPLPNWPDVHFFISVDGTEDHHEYMRNKKGIYKRIQRNANRPDLDITIACCITKQNWESIEEMVKEWNAVEGVSHMVFDFYTPIETIQHPLWLGWDLRDHVLDILLALKEIYGDFITTPERVFRLMKSNVSKTVTDNCLFTSHATAFGPKGEVKEKCMLGPKADCDRCGCVVPFYMHSLVDKKFIVQDNVRAFQKRVRRIGDRLTAVFA
jgi:sulfatase maturation enzyme AslB (radical SAM superfamily)